MPELQPFAIVCTGGLDLVTSSYELLRMPNVATKLLNFEVSNQGGYRRISGFAGFGGGSKTTPTGTTTKILGVIPYGEGVVACAGTAVYYTEDGVTWLQVNKDTTSGGKSEANMPATAALNRPNQARAQFTLLEAPKGRTTALYGSLSIATGDDNLARFRIEGTGGSKTFYYEESATLTGATYVEEHDKHLCVVDATNNPSTVYYSAYNDDSDFTGSGSGSATVPDVIVGIKSFRDSLYIFCKRSIRKLVNINNPAAIQTVEVTDNLGCVSGYTIQEIGGDIVFLSSDGIRTIAGTERLGDIELGTVSKKIQPLISTIMQNPNNYTFSSVVISGKDQYRMFYTNEANESIFQKGIIGTLRANPETGQIGFEWSETRGIEVSAIGVADNNSAVEKIYHGDLDGFVYTHDSGDDLDGTSMTYEYSSPDMDMGDPGLRKTLHYMLLAVKTEGATATITLNHYLDFRSSAVLQPSLRGVGTLSFGSTYGTTVYGTGTYGTSTPTKRINLEGSGTSVAFKFSGAGSTSSFTITGYYIGFVPIDRR